jgi:hypothetical protein
MNGIKFFFQIALLAILGFMATWAYGGSTALDNDRPLDPADEKALTEVLEPQRQADWYSDADDAPKVEEAKSSEEEKEFESVY